MKKTKLSKIDCDICFLNSYLDWREDRYKTIELDEELVSDYRRAHKKLIKRIGYEDLSFSEFLDNVITMTFEKLDMDNSETEARKELEMKKDKDKKPKSRPKK